MRLSSTFVFLLCAGCCTSHIAPIGSADGGPEADTGPDVVADVGSENTTDASPGSHYFTIEARPVSLTVVACGISEGQTAFVRVGIAFRDSCDHPGPVDWGPAPVGSVVPALLVAGHVWVEHGVPCNDVGGEVDRDLAIPGLAAGAWTVSDANGAAMVTLDVWGPPPPVTCTSTGPAGASCAIDCDCAGGAACVPLAGDAVCAAACGAPCNERLDCDPSFDCVADPSFASPRCAAATTPSCVAGADCPAGMLCAIPRDTGPPPYCEWAVVLDAGQRHSCTDESECAAGLDCVQHADGPRACEVRCTTDSMRCPFMHACSEPLGVESPERWVCEWVGE